MQTLDVPYKINGKNLTSSVDRRDSSELIEEIVKALKSVGGYGSIEIYVQDHSVTQITVRNIKKTKHTLAEWDL